MEDAGIGQVSSGGSISNELEAEVVKKLVERLERVCVSLFEVLRSLRVRKEPRRPRLLEKLLWLQKGIPAASIGVMCMYRKQMDLMRKRLKREIEVHFVSLKYQIRQLS